MKETKVLRAGIEIGAGPPPLNAEVRSARPGELSPVVVVCPGFLGYSGWGFFPYVSEVLALSGFHVLTMIFSHSGTDPDTGRIVRPSEFAADTVSKELEDLDAAVSFVMSEEFPLKAEGGIGLLGHSRGGSVAILTASRREGIGSLVTWSAPSTLDRYTSRRKDAWKRTGALVFEDPRAEGPLRLDYSYYEDIERNREEFDLPAAVSRLSIPYLAVHGERDAAVPLREAGELLAGAGGGDAALEIIPGCGHTFGAAHPMRCPGPAIERVARLTCAWFERTLGRRERSR